MQPGIPSEQEVLNYFQTLSNWGRWGGDDELGTLNFITPQKRLEAASLIREGVTVSCATTIRNRDSQPHRVPGPEQTLASSEAV